jgi:hypothetical protein
MDPLRMCQRTQLWARSCPRWHLWKKCDSPSPDVTNSDITYVAVLTAPLLLAPRYR